MGGFEVMSIVLPIVITVVVLVATVIPILLFLVPFLKRQSQAAKLMASGESAQGQILAVQETGTRINDQPEVNVTLLVTRQGQAPYQVQCATVVSQMTIPRMQPGMNVPVKVDPANPQNVTVDKAALSMMPMGGMPGAMPGVMPGAMPGVMPGVMPGAQPGMMSPQQAMAMAQAAAAQPPAGGSIINCTSCGNPYASANPMCPNCGAAKPQGY